MPYSGPDRRRSVSLPPACADLWVSQMTAMLAVVRAARSLKLIGYTPHGYPMVGELALKNLGAALDSLDQPIARDTTYSYPTPTLPTRD